MSAMASQITSLTIVYSTVYSDADQRKHQRSASLAFVRGIHRWPVKSPHKGPVTRKILLFDDVIMEIYIYNYALTIIFQHRYGVGSCNPSSWIYPQTTHVCYTDICMAVAGLATHGIKAAETMMTSPNGSLFRVTGPFVRGIHRSPVCGEFTGHRWITFTKGQ